MTALNINQKAATGSVDSVATLFGGYGAALNDKDGHIAIKSELAKLRVGQSIDQVVGWSVN